MKTTATDLILFYELLKPGGEDLPVESPAESPATPPVKATSKPNVPKVEAIARGMILTTLHASSGMGTTVGVALRAMQHAATMVLSQSDEGDFEQNKATILTQLQLVVDAIKGTKPQQAKADLKALQEAIQAMISKGQAAPKGALKDAPAGTGTTPDTNDVEAKVQDALTEALSGDAVVGPKKDDIVH